MSQNRRSDGRKMFLFAFLLTLLALAAIMVVTVLAVQPSMPEGVQNQQAAEQSYRPPAIDTLTMVVIGTQGGKAEDFLLIRFNPQYGQIPLTLLPANTAVTLDGQPYMLSQTFASGGGRAVKSALSDLLGIRVDRYAVIAGNAFVRIAAKTGTVEFTLPDDYSYTRDGYSVSLPAGKRRLDGQDVLDLFASPALSGDTEKKSQLLGDVCAAIVNQNIGVAAEENSSGLFKFAINLVQTDISSVDYEPRRESLHFLSTLGAQVSGNLPLTGEAGENGTFVPSTAYIDLVRQYFEPA